MVGGPYTDVRGEEHTYGHAALRTISPTAEYVYDFGRYAGETGPTGQGRLRVWTSFSRYIASENSYGRITKGFFYSASDEEVARANNHFKGLIGDRPSLRGYGDYMNEYRLAQDYNALTNNCVTTALGGARKALSSIDFDVANHNQGRGLSFAERTAARLAGWPSHIFMPADLRAMLEANTAHPPQKTEEFGEKK